MEFVEIKYPDAPVLRKKLLGEVKIPEYTCKLFQNLDGPFFVLDINGRKFLVKVGSLFRAIINEKNIKPLKDGK